MRIKNRLSPYPILNDYGDDYIESSFEANYEVIVQFNNVCGTIDFDLKNKEIEELIKDEKAQYLVHIECPSTCYRKVYSSNENEISFTIDSVNLSNTIEIRTFIVLTEDIEDFSSSDFHPDYLGQHFNLSAHQIIAIGTAKNFDIEKDERDLESLPSIIQIVKLKDKKKGTLTVNTDDDKFILVGLTEEVYGLYARLGKNIYKSTAFSLVLLPVLLIVLQRMHANMDDGDFTSRHWFKVIKSILEKNGVDLAQITIDNDSLLTICQSIFADPISRSFKELNDSVERM